MLVASITGATIGTIPARKGTKHRRIAELLEREIASGRWPVSGLLPPEMELVTQFGVSRQTIRSAISSLISSGLVTSQQGVGTRVLRQQPAPEYSQSLEDISALADYARNTAVEVVRVQDVVLTPELAAVIGAVVGETWCHALTLRSAPGQKVPMGVSSVWVPVGNRQAIQASRKSGLAVFQEVQKANRKMVSEVRQMLGACLPDKTQAQLLHCDIREPLLRIRRWYHAADGTLLEMSDTLHPPSRFQYVMTLRHGSLNGSSPASKAIQ